MFVEKSFLWLNMGPGYGVNLSGFKAKAKEQNRYMYLKKVKKNKDTYITKNKDI